MSEAPAPPQYSPDGRWWWNTQEWVAVPQPIVEPPVIRTYKDGKAFAKDAAVMAAHGYEIVSQIVVPNKPRWNHGMVAIQKNPGSTIVVTYQHRR